MKVLNIFRILFWLLLGIILAISLMPAADAPTVFAYDKLNHGLAFFTLLMIFGGGIELLQWSMGLGRDADWMDFAADIVAIVLGLLAGKLFWYMRGKRMVAE